MSEVRPCFCCRRPFARQKSLGAALGLIPGRIIHVCPPCLAEWLRRPKIADEDARDALWTLYALIVFEALDSGGRLAGDFAARDYARHALSERSNRSSLLLRVSKYFEDNPDAASAL